MRYPVAIHYEDGSAYGVTVLDIPGCFSAGETFDEALDNTKLAIQEHLEILAESGTLAPVASQISTHINSDACKSATLGFIEIDISAYSGKTEKINVTLPRLTNTLIDTAIKQGLAKNRSAFLSEAAAEKLQKIHP